jgi:hypothetical protein
MPTRRASSTIGSEPMSSVFISFAASRAGVPGSIVVGFDVIAS